MNYSTEKMRRLAKKKEDEDRIGWQANKLVPIAQWDRGVLRSIARDRGYRTDESVVYAVSIELKIAMSAARVLLETGTFSWGQVLAVGALFEMSPKEFADVFLKDYFQETRDGEYRAYVEDATALLQPMRRIRPLKQESCGDGISANED